MKESKKEFEEIKAECGLGERESREVDDALRLLEARIGSIEVKERGDEAFKLKDYQKA